MILLAILFMWLSQFKWLFVVIPKNIKIIDTFNVCPIYLQHRRFDFLLTHVKYHKFSFLTFRESLLAYNHLYISANSLFIFWLCPSKDSNLFNVLDKVVSSANIINLKRSLESAMSLIYIINRSGPKIDPWGHQ